MKKTYFALMAGMLVAGTLAVLAAETAPQPYKHFDLGVGSYGANYAWGCGSLIDLARYDWAYICFGNEDGPALVERLNNCLKMNPDFKMVIRLWPAVHYHRPADAKDAPARKVLFLDYLYYPEAKAAFFHEAFRQLHLILDNVSKPGNVYGITVFEELPAHFCIAKQDLIRTAAPGTPVDEYLADFAPMYEKETGKKMTEWNRDVRIWWGRKFVQVMRDIYAQIRAEAPEPRIFCYLMTHYRLLDWLDPGEDVHSMSVIPCHWRELVEPGVAADGFFAYNNNAAWAARYQNLARENHWPYFSQLSHTAKMRLSSWDECLAIAKADLPENLGYFYYQGDFEYGHWNDDPDVPPEDRASVTGMYNRARRFLAKEDIGMDVVRRELAPDVVCDHALGRMAKSDYGMMAAVIVNKRLREMFTDPREATLRNVKVRVTLPPAFALPADVSPAAEMTIPEIEPGERKQIIWWPQRMADPQKDETFPVTLTVTAEGVRPVTITCEAPEYHRIPAEAFDVARSGETFTYFNFGIPAWGEQPTRFTVTCIAWVLHNPALINDQWQPTYPGVLKQGDKLVIETRSRTPAKVTLVPKMGAAADVTECAVGSLRGVSRGISTLTYKDDYTDTGVARARIGIEVLED